MYHISFCLNSWSGPTTIHCSFKDLHMICNLLEGARTIDKFVVFDDFGINLGSDKSYNLQRYTKLYDVLYPK
mgnify:CR=1 FL=1